MASGKTKNVNAILNGKFTFKKLPNGGIDRTKVICSYCQCEMTYHRSLTSLKYHLTHRHTVAVDSPAPRQSQSQASMDSFRQKTMDGSTKKRLTEAIARWVATSCRPISIVEDDGLEEILRIASNDFTYELPSRATIANRIQDVYKAEKAKIKESLEETKAVALTGDYWTSLGNDNYLGVTAHYFDSDWVLRSHALCVMKTEDRHFADTVAEHFRQVAGTWDIESKVVSLTTDSARHMIAGVRQLPFEHLPCTAHIVHRAVTVSLHNSPFDSALAKCRKVVGHFKHSPANQAELEQQQVAHNQKKESLAQEVPTRWNSTLEMIKRIQENADPLRATLALHTPTVAMPTAAELEKLKRLEAVLEHCR